MAEMPISQPRAEQGEPRQGPLGEDSSSILSLPLHYRDIKYVGGEGGGGSSHPVFDTQQLSKSNALWQRNDFRQGSREG